MATFTIELRHVDELYDVRKMALSTYPLFDEDYRDGLNQKILDHFWLREIAHETPQIFFLMLRRKMNEIMPYFNKLYLTERMEYDPLSTVDIYSVNRGEAQQRDKAHSSGEAESTGEAASRGITSNYPQGMLSGSEDYATDGSDSKSTTGGTEKTSADNSTEAASRSIGDSKTTGRSMPAAALVMAYRETLLNLDMEVIAQLEPLFMQLWSNDDFEPDEPHYLFNPISY